MFLNEIEQGPGCTVHTLAKLSWHLKEMKSKEGRKNQDMWTQSSYVIIRQRQTELEQCTIDSPVIYYPQELISYDLI